MSTPEQDVPEVVPVADQKAAGVPPEQTVTIADQKAGTPPPDLPDEGTTEVPQTGLSQSASNESPVLPANAQAAAAKAHASLDHVIQVLQAAKADIAKYVPEELMNAAQRDVSAFVKSIL